LRFKFSPARDLKETQFYELSSPVYLSTVNSIVKKTVKIYSFTNGKYVVYCKDL
jgi:hypothetical protein